MKQSMKPTTRTKLLHFRRNFEIARCFSEYNKAAIFIGLCQPKLHGIFFINCLRCVAFQELPPRRRLLPRQRNAEGAPALVLSVGVVPVCRASVSNGCCCCWCWASFAWWVQQCEMKTSIFSNPSLKRNNRIRSMWLFVATFRSLYLMRFARRTLGH